jgi:hypothetical protein
VSCPSDTLCVAVDHAGNVLTSTDPEAPSPSWKLVTLSDEPPFAAAPLTSVSCPAATLCVAVDSNGRAHTSTAPSGGAGAWSVAPVDPGHALTSVSCPNNALCIAVDDAGQALAGSFPAASWSEPVHAAAAALTAVSCATANDCAAVDAAGDVATSIDGGAGWSSRPLDHGVPLASLSCPATGLCAALDREGDVIASADPWATPPAFPTWSTTQTGIGPSPATVACAVSGLCVITGGGERLIASDSPASPTPQWSESHASGLHVAALSCLPSGACVGIDSAGYAFTGRVPPPEPMTGTPASVSVNTATLAGTLDPNDAVLTGCWFEYGTSTNYAGTVPCASTPGAGSAPSAVTATVGALAPNTVYHYRLVATSAIAQSAGADVSFTTPAAPGAPLLNPHPSIHGTPAVGQHLTCSPGVSGASRLVYAWLRDLVRIPFATGSSYLVKGVDSGRHLQCEVTASDEGGDATARSAFVTIPAGGAPAAAGETTVGTPRLHGRTVLIGVSCSPRAANGCNVSLRLTAVETISGRRVLALAASTRRTIMLASARAFIARGSQRTISLRLTAGARKLLASRHSIPARLVASGTVIGVIEATLVQRVVQLGGARAGGSRRHRSHG